MATSRVWSTESSSMQVLWPRRHHKGTPRLLKSLKPLPLQSQKTACPLAAARGKERAHSRKTKARAKARRTARARARTRTRRTVPRKKPPKAKARARSPTRVKPCCGQRLTQGAPCSTACCSKGLLQTCKGQRTKIFTSWSIACITLEECTCS